MLGALFALLASASFGFNNASIRRGVLTGTVGQAMVITVPLGVPMFLLPGLITGEVWTLAELTSLQWLLFAAAGLSHFVIGRYANYRAVRAIGSNLAGAALQVQLVISLVCALAFLGERLTVMKVIGIVLTLGGSAITLYGRGSTPETAERKMKFTPNYLEGYAFGFICALGYGISPVLVRAALGGSSGFGIAGGLVSYVAATLAVVAMLLASPRQRTLAWNVDRTAARWFFTSGIAVNVSQFLRYVALSIASVTIVATIMQLSGVFRLIFGWFLNREHEVFDLRTVVGIVVAFGGALLLAVEVTTIAGVFGLSAGLAQLLDLSWP